MYQFIDRPLLDLGEGCRFLVWSMRAWVTTIAHRRCPAQALAPAFAKWRMVGGLQPFHRAMLLLNRDALMTLSFSPLPCPLVAEHEAVILGLVTSLHRHDTLQARRTLELLVEEESVGDMLEALTRLGAALAVAGIFPGEQAEAGPRRQ